MRRNYTGGGQPQAGVGVDSQPRLQIRSPSLGTRVRKSAWSECQLVGQGGTLSGFVCHLLHPHWNSATVWWKLPTFRRISHYQWGCASYLGYHQAFRAAILLSPWQACGSQGLGYGTKSYSVQNVLLIGGFIHISFPAPTVRHATPAASLHSPHVTVEKTGRGHMTDKGVSWDSSLNPAHVVPKPMLGPLLTLSSCHCEEDQQVFINSCVRKG